MTRQTIARPPVHRIVLVQLSVSLVIAALFLLRSPEAAYSSLAGGLICAIPNAYFAFKAFQYVGAQQIRHVLRAFYQGGMWKLVLTGIGFGLAFKFLQPIDYLALFSTFVLVQCINVFASKIANL